MSDSSLVAAQRLTEVGRTLVSNKCIEKCLL